MKKFLKIIIYIFIIISIFFIGFFTGKLFRGNLKYILDINIYDVKTLSEVGIVSKDEKIIYEFNGNEIDNQEGWNKLQEIISIQGYERYITRGTTNHIKYKIEMKNGDIYYIEDIGCLNQFDITYPNGKIKKYYGYFYSSIIPN